MVWTGGRQQGHGGRIHYSKRSMAERAV
jgi:hypothetical protein